MKSRKGAALIMALVVVLVGGAVIAVTFNIVFGHVWMSVQFRGSYVDHTTLRSAVEEMKGLIVAENIAANETRRVAAVTNNTDITNAADLRFGGTWVINRVDRSGVGPRRVVVNVYDIGFNFDRVGPDEAVRAALMSGGFFPPALRIEADGGGGGGAMPGQIEDDEDGGPDPGALDTGMVGSYLVRAMLFDDPNADIATARPIRVVEEAFVQIIPGP